MNLLKYKAWYLIFSGLLMLPGIFFIVTEGLQLGIDFTGGSISNYVGKNLDKQYITTVYTDNLVDDVVVTVNENGAVVRSKPVEVATNTKIVTTLKAKYPELKQSSFETIGPAIGAETTKKAFLAVFVSSMAIMLYIAYAFRNIPKPYSSFRFGVSAILAMLHDAIIVLGIFAILGHVNNVEVDALFITALLTIIGFSVHDTIVVFDRIRENLAKLPKTYEFEIVANYSLVETLNRSLTTSLTVVITLLSLFVLGGQSIKYFVFALLVGIISGTYSSIFTATPILVYWENFAHKRAKHRS